MILNQLVNVIYGIGYFSEYIMIAIVFYVLYKQWTKLFIFTVGIYVNTMINMTLKQIIKDPRPKNPIKFLNSDRFDNNITIYGMPSGHSQNVFFSLFYLYLTTHKIIPWTLVGICIAILTFFERLYFNNHSIPQLLVGSILGSIIAYLFSLIKI
jgi:membrane-associated phospholipid phosphatase